MTTVDDLREALNNTGILNEYGWLRLAIGFVAANPEDIEQFFPSSSDAVDISHWLAYRAGPLTSDAAEKLAVLKALPLLPIQDAAVPLPQDALRTNDPPMLQAFACERRAAGRPVPLDVLVYGKGA